MSDAGDVVPLGIDPQLDGFSEPSWTVGDGSLSWIGRRLDGSGAVVEGGIYKTDLLFDTAGNVTGAGSTELLVSLPLVDLGGGSIGPDIVRHDWSPDGTQVVYDTLDRQLVIADLLTGTFDEIATSGPMHSPKWSPAGDKLMVGYQTHSRSAVGVMNTRRFRPEVGRGERGHVVCGRRRLVADRQPSRLSTCRPLLGRFLHIPRQVQRDREKPPYRLQPGMGIPHWANAPRLARPAGLWVRQCPGARFAVSGRAVVRKFADRKTNVTFIS